MNETYINFRTDSATKRDAEKLFQSLGLNMSTALNIYLKKCIITNSLPFDISLDIPNDDTINAINEGKLLSKDFSNCKKYSNFSQILKDIR